MRPARPTRDGGTGEAGFTLIELLIATTVLAFLSLLLFGGLQFGTRVWEKTETSTSAMNRVRAAQQILSDELMHVYPLFVSSPADNYVDFDGEDQHVTFLAPSSDIRGAMDRVTIGSVHGPQGVSVVVSSSPELAAAPQPHRRTIITGLKWFQISYFGPPTAAPHTQTSASALTARTSAPGSTQNAPPQWTSVWQGQARLPMLIRIRASLPDKAQWPDLVITPRIDVDESCVFDEVSKYCQGR